MPRREKRLLRDGQTTNKRAESQTSRAIIPMNVAQHKCTCTEQVVFKRSSNGLCTEQVPEPNGLRCIPKGIMYRSVLYRNGMCRTDLVPKRIYHPHLAKAPRFLKVYCAGAIVQCSKPTAIISRFRCFAYLDFPVL